MGFVSRNFAEVGWRRGLGARKPRSGVRNQRNGEGCRHRRERGAGGRPRCVWWPRCTLCGCEALKSAHLTSRQTVTRRALRITRGCIYFCPSRPLTRSISVVNLSGLSALGRSARRPGGRTRRTNCDRPCPCASCLVAHLQRDVQRHCCGGADRGAMSADE